MFVRTDFSPAKHNTDLEFIETFKKEFFPGVPEHGSQTEITFPDPHQFEVTLSGKPWKRETETTYGQLESPEVRALDQTEGKG